MGVREQNLNPLCTLDILKKWAASFVLEKL